MQGPGVTRVSGRCASGVARPDGGRGSVRRLSATSWTRGTAPAPRRAWRQCATDPHSALRSARCTVSVRVPSRDLAVASAPVLRCCQAWAETGGRPGVRSGGEAAGGGRETAAWVGKSRRSSAGAPAIGARFSRRRLSTGQWVQTAPSGLGPYFVYPVENAIFYPLIGGDWPVFFPIPGGNDGAVDVVAGTRPTGPLPSRKDSLPGGPFRVIWGRPINGMVLPGWHARCSSGWRRTGTSVRVFPGGAGAALPRLQ